MVAVVLGLPCLVFSGAADPASSRCPALLPRPPVPYAGLKADIDRIVTAPAGTTSTLHFSEREMESFLNSEALPLAGLGAVRVGLRLHPGRAELAVLVVQDRCLAILELRQIGEAGEPGLALGYAKLGPIRLPAVLRGTLSRVLNETLTAGDLGLRLWSLHMEQGAARVTLSRE